MTLADDYRQQYGWRSWAELYERLPLQGGHRVLDLGCAIGDQTAALAERGATVLGIDGNAELLAAARARGIPRATFLEADLATWTDPSLGADGLWSAFTAAYFTAFQPVLERWVSALRPGAWVMLVEIDGLFDHGPVSDTTRTHVERFYRDSLEHGRYDFRMGRKLRHAAEGVGLEIVAEANLADQELAFGGPAAPAVIEAWRRRFARMKSLQRFLGPAFEAVQDDFLAALASPAHSTSARVVCVQACKP